MMSVLPSGSHASMRKRKRGRTISGEREIWSAGCFAAWARTVPGGLFIFFFFFFSLFLFLNLFENFANKLRIDSNQF
jgi:hypothetical protein